MKINLKCKDGPLLPSNLKQLLLKTQEQLSVVKNDNNYMIYYEKYLEEMLDLLVCYTIEGNDRYFEIIATVNASPEVALDKELWSKYFGKIILVLEELDFTPVTGDRWTELTETTPPVIDYVFYAFEPDDVIDTIIELRKRILKLNDPVDWPSNEAERLALKILLNEFVKDIISKGKFEDKSTGWRSFNFIYNEFKQHINYSRSTLCRLLNSLSKDKNHYIDHPEEKRIGYRINPNTCFVYAALAEINRKTWTLLLRDYWYLRLLSSF